MDRKEFDHVTLHVFPTRKEMGMVAALDAAAYINSLHTKQDVIRCIFAAAPSQSDFLEAMFSDSSIDFSRIEAFNMDDYIGLSKDDPQSFSAFLAQYFNRVPLRSVECIRGENEPSAECLRYSTLLSERPIDIVFMGIGENGHIAFNDPGVADFHDEALVKIVELEPSCRQQQVNDGCFSNLQAVPTRAITLTIPALLSANKHFCIVPAATKARALRDTLLSSISEECPATILRTKPDVSMYTDGEGYELLQQSI